MDAEAVRQPSSTSPTGPVTLAGEAPLLLPVAMSGTSSGGAVANMTHRRSGAEDDGPTASAAVSPSPQPSQQQQQVGGGAGGVGQPVDVFANAMPAEHARGRPQTSRGLSAIRALLAQLSELRTDGTIRGDSDTERLMQPGGISGRHSAERLVGGGASSTASGNGGEQSGIRRALLRELSRRTPETVEDGAGGGANGGTEAAAETNENDDETPAAAAERYRLGNNSALDLSATAVWLEQLLPFVFLLLLVFLSQHLTGLLVFFWLSSASLRANEIIQKQVALKEEKRALVLLWVAALLVVHLLVSSIVLQNEDVPVVGLALPKEVSSVWHALYLVAILDNKAILLGMLVKVWALMFHKNRPGKAFRRQGQILTFLEYALSTWRALSPSGVWYQYFLTCGLAPFGASVFAGTYLSLKLSSLSSRLWLAAQAFKTVMYNEAQYGQYASHEEVMEAGNTCSICQENMTNPLKLPCKHIYCEECVSEWFERERTCPLCRAVIRPAGLRSFADGSTTTAPQLF